MSQSFHEWEKFYVYSAFTKKVQVFLQIRAISTKLLETVVFCSVFWLRKVSTAFRFPQAVLERFSIAGWRLALLSCLLIRIDRWKIFLLAENFCTYETRNYTCFREYYWQLLKFYQKIRSCCCKSLNNNLSRKTFSQSLFLCHRKSRKCH